MGSWRLNTGIMNIICSQDEDSFVCHQKTELCIFSLDPLSVRSYFTEEQIGKVLICEILELETSTNLLIVPARRPNILLVLDTSTQEFILVKPFQKCINCLKVRNNKLAVWFSETLRIYTFPDFENLAEMKVPSEALPIIALATASEPGQVQYLAAPGHRPGRVQLLDVSSRKKQESYCPDIIDAHKTSLSCIAITDCGSKMATTSRKGTIIRVYDTTTRNLEHELRRGIDRAEIYCLSFSPSGQYLCLTCDKGTVHLWNDTNGEWSHVGSKKISTALTPRMFQMMRKNNIYIFSTDGCYQKMSFSEEGFFPVDDYRFFLRTGDSIKLQ